MVKNKGGRPPKYTKEIKKDLYEKFEMYINKTTIPILAEFAYKNNVPKQTFYDWPEFSNLLKKCMNKKEVSLEKGVLFGKLNAAMGIFSLKQLGWTDKQDLSIKGNIGIESGLESKLQELFDKHGEDKIDEIFKLLGN